MPDRGIPGIELTQWRAGRVLDADDVQMLERFLAEVESEERANIDAILNVERDVLMRLGGQQLVDAFEAEDADALEVSVQRAMKLFYEKLAAKRAASN
jgi:hypothetical protein